MRGVTINGARERTSVNRKVQDPVVQKNAEALRDNVESLDAKRAKSFQKVSFLDSVLHVGLRAVEETVNVTFIGVLLQVSRNAE